MEDFVSINVNTGRSRTNSLINRKMIFRILGILLSLEAAMFWCVRVCRGIIGKKNISISSIPY